MQRLAVIAYHSSPLAEPGSGDAGGMSVYVREVAAHLAASGVHSDIFTRATTDIPRITQVGTDVRVVGITAGPNRPVPKEELPAHIGDFVAGIRAFRTTQRVSYDAIHSHYWQSGVAAAELSAAWDVPLIHSNHTLGLLKNRSLSPGDQPESTARIAAERAVMAHADVLIASTDLECEQMACLYGVPHDRLKTVHPGVDHGMFSPGDRGAARAGLGLDPDRSILLVVGRIQPLKGIDLAIRALEHLSHALDRPPLLVIVGGASGATGGSESDRLRALSASLGIDGLVRFEGPVPHRTLPQWYRAADVTLLCSHYESFGLTALESQACGTPVIGTPVGAVSFVVEDGRSGFLIPSRDPTELATRAKTLLSDRDAHARASRAAVESSLRFSWDGAAAELAELYDCLVRDRLPEACTC